MDGKSGSIFDIDGTLYKGFFIADLAKFLAERGKFKKSALEKAYAAFADYRTGKTGYRQAAKAIVDAYAEGIAGQSVSEVMGLARQLVEKNKEKFFPDAKQLVAKQKKQGRVFAVSLSPNECIGQLVGLFGFERIYGIWFRSKNGKYTGKYSAPNLQIFKKNAIGTIIGMFKLDPKKTRFFGDTVEDLLATRNVPIKVKGRAIARTNIAFTPINPDAVLKMALKQPPRIRRSRTAGRKIVRRKQIKR